MGKNMKLRIRYENEYQVIELDEKAANRLWVSLSLTGGEDMTKEEKEQRIQEAWHEHFNKSDYNCFHKFDRHRGNSKAQLNVDADNLDISEPLMDEVLDSRIFCNSRHCASPTPQIPYTKFCKNSKCSGKSFPQCPQFD